MSDTLVVVEQFTHDWQAQIARSVLEGAGIHAAVVEENIFRVLPHTGDTRGVKLQVWERDLPEARMILNDDSLDLDEKSCP